jgi:hypothetical protein
LLPRSPPPPGPWRGRPRPRGISPQAGQGHRPPARRCAAAPARVADPADRPARSAHRARRRHPRRRAGGVSRRATLYATRAKGDGTRRAYRSAWHQARPWGASRSPAIPTPSPCT